MTNSDSSTCATVAEKRQCSTAVREVIDKLPNKHNYYKEFAKSALWKVPDIGSVAETDSGAFPPDHKPAPNVSWSFAKIFPYNVSNRMHEP